MNWSYDPRQHLHNTWLLPYLSNLHCESAVPRNNFKFDSVVDSLLCSTHFFLNFNFQRKTFSILFYPSYVCCKGGVLELLLSVFSILTALNRPTLYHFACHKAGAAGRHRRSSYIWHVLNCYLEMQVPIWFPRVSEWDRNPNRETSLLSIPDLKLPWPSHSGNGYALDAFVK